jgi:EthD domain
MPKILALIKRLPHLDRDAFREHYEGRHVVVAKPLLSHLVAYARHHIEAELVGRAEFDVVTAFAYPDRAAVEAMFAMLAGDAAAPILEDERRFMDKPGNRFFEVSERPWIPQEGRPALPGSEREEERSIFVFVARPKEVSRADFARRLLRDHWPALLGDGAGLRYAIARDAFPMGGNPPPWDGSMQLPVMPELDLSGFAAGLEAEGHRVLAIRTRRFVTPLPPA